MAIPNTIAVDESLLILANETGNRVFGEYRITEGDVQEYFLGGMIRRRGLHYWDLIVTL